jgi:putative DNA primase/helicase
MAGRDDWMDAGLAKVPAGGGGANGHHGGKTAPEPPVPVLRPLSDYAAEPVPWLWRPWISSRTLAVLDGDPGVSKSTLALDLAARITRGWDMPFCEDLHPRPPAAVLLLSAEDDPNFTIRPRLDAIGADVGRVHYFSAVSVAGDSRPPVLPWDLDLVAGRVRDLGVSLVVVDPFTAFLSDEFDAHKDADIRRCLHRLAIFAREKDVTVLAVRHLNKLAGGPALYRGGGSIAIVGGARTAMVLGRDPDDPQTRVLAMNKSNLGPRPKSLTLTLEPTAGDVHRIGWKGQTDLGADDILWHDHGKSQGRPDESVQDAMTFLRNLLAHGPQAVKMIRRDADDAGIAWRTLERAKVALRVDARREGGVWLWVLDKG